MASVSSDRYGFIIGYRPPHGARRNLRLRRIDTPHGETFDAEFARRRADEIEHLCRLIEISPFPEAVARAVELRAINPEEADTILHSQSPIADLQSAALPQPLTIIEAYRQHPSVRRGKGTTEGHRHENLLEQFLAFAQITKASDLTLEKVQAWIEHLETQGRSYDGIRHALLPIRRASRMASSHGLSDPLSRLQLLKRHRTEINAWELRTLARGFTLARQAGDHRAAALISLGAFLGLRPSEIRRARITDIEGYGGTLDNYSIRIGTREAKNHDSIRQLPLPAIVAESLLPILDRPGHIALIESASRHRPNPSGEIHDRQFSHWAMPLLTRYLGGPEPSAKTLRKSFASWAIDVIPEPILEDFLGHRSTALSAVTSQHYKAKSRLTKLRPYASLLNASIHSAIQSLQIADL